MHTMLFALSVLVYCFCHQVVWYVCWASNIETGIVCDSMTSCRLFKGLQQLGVVLILHFIKWGSQLCPVGDLVCIWK